MQNVNSRLLFLVASMVVAIGLPFQAHADLQNRLKDGRAISAHQSGGQILSVGPGKAFSVPSKAAKVARDGDIIEILAGTYRGDVAVWRANNLVIRGVGGRVVLDAAGKSAGGKAIWAGTSVARGRIPTRFASLTLRRTRTGSRSHTIWIRWPVSRASNSMVFSGAIE